MAQQKKRISKKVTTPPPYQIQIEDVIFEDIKGYEGLYQINRLGEILVHPAAPNNGSRRRMKGRRTLRPVVKQNGYLGITLNDSSGQRKSKFVHRLVALQFIPLVKGKPYVDHINGIKTNCAVYNLRWCSAKENTAFMHQRLGSFERRTWLTPDERFEIMVSKLPIDVLRKKFNIDRRTVCFYRAKGRLLKPISISNHVIQYSKAV